MKRLLSIMLSVLIIASLGIMMFPTQSVEAKYEHKQGIVYHIKAEGQGTCEYWPPFPIEQVNGEFSINLNGSGHFYSYGRGLAFHGGGGHIKGSFDDHEIDAALQVSWLQCNTWHGKYPDMPITLHFKAKGFYDGERAIDGWDHLGPIKPDATEMKLVVSLTDKNNIQHVTTIYMDDSADIFKADIDLVGY